ncbi:hypothetical protein [Pelosinus baikalensis]|uniref:Uncharacterized protein n=1 Tax=Pelosinus baikalensis TaxID=2892015 RepID=A0ABS8HZH7_9FIRM|nr:hypothetical protein [Pelosinus baikalensis]MCC5468577.1 hypothetical protein [Pelosinus baikalensis]MCC5468586.1 hypothetical protein [Pelosinus baikalensis]
MAIVSVDVDLDEFGDEDLLEEVKKRGLLKAESNDYSEIISLLENSSGAAVIKTGVGEAFSVSVGGNCSYADNGRSTIIVISGE